MSSEAPPIQDGHDSDYFNYERRGVNMMLIFGIAAFAVLSFYLWLMIATRVDSVLFPGNELSIGGAIGGVIGIDEAGSNGPATPEQRINILVMGLDQRLDEADDQPYRTDSVVIFSIDPFTKTAGAFSIPRDTRVAIPYEGDDWTYTRINEVYEMGEYGVGGFPTRGKGAELAMETIDYNFNIPIDYYVIINWTNFIDIVDDLGGITIDVPDYVYDSAYSNCTYCSDVYPVEFEPGIQEMDGMRALEYARIRKSDNDYKRIERQQLVMRAIAVKATSLDLLDVGKALDLYGSYKDSVKTNVRDSQLPGLARLGGQVGLANVKLVSAGPATYPCPYSICGGAAELLWDRTEFERLKALVFSDQRVINEGAKINVLNGTNTRGLAARFADQIALEGISYVDIKKDEDANGLIWDTTLVIDLTNSKRQTLELLKGELELGDADVYTPADIRSLFPELEEYLDTTADVVVILGADHQVQGPTYYYDESGGYDYTEPEFPEPTEEPVYIEPTPEPEPVITDPPLEEPTPEPIVTEPPLEEVPQE